MKHPVKRLEQHIEDAARPFRLYDAKAKKFFAYRYYVHKLAAMRSALWIAKWLHVGDTVEVIDVRNGRLHGAYTRRLEYVQFHHETIAQLPSEERIRRPGDDNGQ